MVQTKCSVRHGLHPVFGRVFIDPQVIENKNRCKQDLKQACPLSTTFSSVGTEPPNAPWALQEKWLPTAPGVF